MAATTAADVPISPVVTECFFASIENPSKTVTRFKPFLGKCKLKVIIIVTFFMNLFYPPFSF